MAETDSRILEYLEEGLFLYGVGKVQESIARWRKVLELDPKNERAMDYIESAGGDVSAFRAKAASAAGPVGSVAAPAPAAKPAPAPAPAADNPWSRGTWEAPVVPAGADPWGAVPSVAPAVPAWQQAPAIVQQPAPRPVAPAPAPPVVQRPVAPAPAPAPVPAPAPAPRPAPAPVAAVPAPAPAPRSLPVSESREDLLAKAAALYRAKYHEAALELLERLARDFPPVDETLQGYLDAARAGMAETLKTQWARTDLVPRPRLGPAQIMQLKLSPEAGFMLSRIDGMSSVEEIISMAGLDQFTALRALNVLLQQGAIELAQP